ncbi:MULTISPECIES: hypothetical protein [unclassified Tenacibaculum]|uniref:hypothetical protein n=1 Tax=unclassified Tenacibaculum TaxID=2635139 RepID=UPI001F37981C|nr:MULTISPECIES: hypothetical protein [unclassified Tenacibaculum]MCF2875415.1 hypothetical protein [Tenacibaculum sp. Cn5-1]MCF2935491.1 hypothetical protein [Tenacibaculum sp. Cn5-34]MCG7512051.1 hypothetical protein [Tenacibaculum sp. Cn5-46]
MITEITIKGKKYFKDSYDGDFEDLILENLDEDDIQDYSERNLDMVHEDEIDYNSIDDFTEEELLDQLKHSGYIFIKAESLTEEMRIKETIEAIKL